MRAATETVPHITNSSFHLVGHGETISTYVGLPLRPSSSPDVGLCPLVSAGSSVTAVGGHAVLETDT